MWRMQSCFQFLLTIAISCTGMLSAAAQTAPPLAHVHFSKLMEVSQTPYVIASTRHFDKIYNQKTNFLLFINTLNGESFKLDFPENASLGEPKELRIDSLQIHCLVLMGRTKNVNNDKGIDWNDPAQLFVISTDGKQTTQLTTDSFYVQHWEVNRHTGRLMVTGYYDANANRKYDRGDINEIQVFDLRSLKLVFRL